MPVSNQRLVDRVPHGAIDIRMVGKLIGDVLYTVQDVATADEWTVISVEA